MRVFGIVVIASLSMGLATCTPRGANQHSHARWDVKTLHDFDTDWLISGGLYPAEHKSIEELSNQNPPEILHNISPRQSQERVLVVVGGWIHKKPTVEEDGDLHLRLFNKDDKLSINAEIANPEDPDVSGSRFSDYYKAVHDWVRDSLTSDRVYPCHVMVTGVRYFDNSHHTNGQYSVEIHPVLGIRLAKNN